MQVLCKKTPKKPKKYECLFTKARLRESNDHYQINNLALDLGQTFLKLQRGTKYIKGTKNILNGH